MHFCQLRGLHNDPVLKLDGMEIPVVEQYTFLGVICDKKLSFIPHIKYLKAKYHKALQLLRVFALTDLGDDKSTLLKLYRSVVRSKLDYACFIYGSARKSYLCWVYDLQLVHCNLLQSRVSMMRLMRLP